MNKQELLEKLAALEHEQWEEWSKAVASDVKNPERLERWKTNWVPYDQLDESTKDLDREWAEEVMKLVEPYLAKEEKEVAESKYPALAKVLGRKS